MALYKIFRHGDKWRYRDTRVETSKEVDTFVLESILGVIGGPLVSVYRPVTNSGLHLRVDIENGFITSVLKGTLEHLKANKGVPAEDFHVYSLA